MVNIDGIGEANFYSSNDYYQTICRATSKQVSLRFKELKSRTSSPIWQQETENTRKIETTNGRLPWVSPIEKLHIERWKEVWNDLVVMHGFMTSHVQRPWWIWEVPLGNLLENPLICSLSVMDSIPYNPNLWVFAGFGDHNLLPIHSPCCSTPCSVIEVIFATVSTACHQRLLKTFQNVQIKIQKHKCF